MSQEPTQPLSVENIERTSPHTTYPNNYNGRTVPSADGDIEPLPGDTTADTELMAHSFSSDGNATDTEALVQDEATASEADPDPMLAGENPIEVGPEAPKGKPRKSFWREVVETIILTILIFFLVKSLVQNFRIQGMSMEPNFHTDQYILVNKVAYFHVDVNAFLRIIPGVEAKGVHNVWLFGGPHRGDVIVFQYPKLPEDDYIKRVIAFPGETIAVHHNIAYVNGKPLAEPYIKQEEAFGYTSEYPETIVQPDELFVMGDNRNGSSDSRIWGLLPVNNIIGKAWFDYWPFFKTGWGFIPEIHSDFAH